MGRRIIIAAIAGIVIWSLFGYAAKPNTIIALDVGQGLSMLFTDTSGWQLLYDGGPGGIAAAALGRVLPIWDTYIDVIALSHAHQDHSAGLLTVLDRYHVGEIWLTAPTTQDAETAQIIQRAHDRNIPIVIIQRGTVVLTPGGSKITALSPEEPFLDQPPPHAHVTTPILVISNPSGASVMLTGDLDAEDENELLAFCAVSVLCPSSITVLQVAHHGSKFVTSSAFLRRFQPKIALISAGEDNRYNHPHPETLERLQTTSVAIQRTDELGSITLKLDQTP